MISSTETCDHGNCPAAAQVRVALFSDDSELLFCGHHYFQHSEALAGTTYVVLAPSTSAPQAMVSRYDIRTGEIVRCVGR